jgi:hypothetical protein
LIDRRTLLEALVGIALAPAALARAQAPAAGARLDPALERALAESPYAHCRCERTAGGRCHSEVWYGWVDRAVVVICDQ